MKPVMNAKRFALSLISAFAMPLYAAEVASAKAPDVALPAVGFGELMSVSVGLMVVLGMLLGGAWLLRRVPGNRLGQGESPIEVISQRSLGLKDKLIWVRVDGENVLLGASTGQMRALHQWPERGARNHRPKDDFGAQLNKEMRASQDGEPS